MIRIEKLPYTHKYSYTGTRLIDKWDTFDDDDFLTEVQKKTRRGVVTKVKVKTERNIEINFFKGNHNGRPVVFVLLPEVIGLFFKNGSLVDKHQFNRNKTTAEKRDAGKLIENGTIEVNSSNFKAQLGIEYVERKNKVLCLTCEAMAAIFLRSNAVNKEAPVVVAYMGQKTEELFHA